MQVNEYQKEAMATLNPALNQKDVLINSVMGLCGESGEAAEKHQPRNAKVEMPALFGEVFAQSAEHDDGSVYNCVANPGDECVHVIVPPFLLPGASGKSDGNAQRIHSRG